MILRQAQEEGSDPIVVPPAEFFRPYERVQFVRMLWESRMVWALVFWWLGIAVGAFLQAISP